MFFDTDVFLDFIDDCRKFGINCPIVPGLMCINNYAGFAKMTKFCKTRVPPALREQMEAIKDNPDEIKQFGMDFGATVCQQLLDSGKVNVLHFYTLNLEKVVYGVLDKLGWSENALAAANENDAASQVAKGSAWARVGDKVETAQGTGVVVEIDGSTGAAKVELDGQTVSVAKGEYKKVF